MLISLIRPVLRRNENRIIRLILQIMFGTAVATLALQLVLQEHAALSVAAQPWAQASSMVAALVSPTAVPASETAVVRLTVGRWRRPASGEHLSLLDELAPFETYFAFVNSRYVNLFEPTMKTGNWLSASDWPAPDNWEIPIVLSSTAAERISPSGMRGTQTPMISEFTVKGIVSENWLPPVQASPLLHDMVLPEAPIIYLPDWAEHPLNEMKVIRQGDMTPSPTSWFGSLNPDQISTAQAWTLAMAEANSRRHYRVMSGPLNTVAAILLVLTAIGMTGVQLQALETRRREFGIRLALGETPLGLARQTAAETTVIMAVGGFMGAGLGSLLWPVLPGMQSSQEPLIVAAPMLATSATIVLSLVISLAPAFIAARTDPDTAIRNL